MFKRLNIKVGSGKAGFHKAIARRLVKGLSGRLLGVLISIASFSANACASGLDQAARDLLYADLVEQLGRELRDSALSWLETAPLGYSTDVDKNMYDYLLRTEGKDAADDWRAEQAEKKWREELAAAEAFAE